MSVAGMVVGAVRDRIARRCARAAPGQGRLHARAPVLVPAPDLVPSLVRAPVLVRALALSPRHILRGLGAVVGLGLIAAVVEATAEMISGTAGPVHQPRRTYEDRNFLRGLALLQCAIHPLKIPNTTLFTDRLMRIYSDFLKRV